MLVTDIATSLLSSYIYDEAKRLFYKRKKIIKFNSDTIGDAIERHLDSVRTWSEEFKHKSMSSKRTDTHYINLKYYTTPRRDQFDIVTEDAHHIDLREHFETTPRNTILLGQPGAGKTTSTKYVAYKILTDERFCRNTYKIPVVIRLNELKNTKEQKYPSGAGAYEGIFHQLLGIFGIHGTEQFQESDSPLLQDLILDILEEQQIFLILDGFDECTFDDKHELVEEIRKLSLRLNKGSFLLTSRTVEFPYNIENADTFEIAPLEDDQILAFARTWLNDEALGTTFHSQLMSSTYLDTARRPLILSLLLTIFARTSPRTIPRKPNSIYSKVIELLIREWDEEKNVVRKSRYATFQQERKKTFLCKLSFYLTKNQHGTNFTRHTIRMQYLEICESFDLPREESHDVLSELESHSGLFLKSGENRFQFAHKSIQEYFTAEYLKGLPKLSDKYISLKTIPNELAILVAIASEPNEYFENIVDIIISKRFPLSFIAPFLNRLYLENPDFISSEELGIAILKLFTYVYRINEGIDRQYGAPATSSHVECIDKITQLIAHMPVFANSIYMLDKRFYLSPEVSNRIFAASVSGRTDLHLEDVVQISSSPELPLEPLMTKLAYIGKWAYVHPFYMAQMKKQQIAV